MRLRLATFILVTTCLSPAFAADLEAPSHVDAVTVYPSGAEVTRVTEAHLLAGETTLILEDLPGELDAQSIRVEGAGGEGLEIGSVDSKLVYLSTAAQDAERKSLEKEIETLGDERQALDQTLSDADYQKRLLLSLADKQLVPSSDDKSKTVDAGQLGSLLDLVSAKLNVISKTIHEAQIRQRDIDKQVNELNNKLAGIAPAQIARMQVAVHLTAPAETNGSFKVKYRVGNAGWAPFYDARLTTPEKNQKSRIELVRRAEVMQSTGESWENVALTLSTARPLGATAAPDLYEQEIQIYTPLQARMKAEADGLARDDENLPASSAAPKEMGQLLNAFGDKKKDAIQKQAIVEMAGFQALYGIQGRVSVDNSGTSKKVRIATDGYDATLNALVVPKLDASAYLTAAFTIKGEAPMLPGMVNLYRDGVFMGQGALPLLSPDEEAKLGFGVDDLIKVKRAEVKRQKGEEGIISTSNVEERAWDIVVKNLHAAAIPVTVIDQLPFSANEKVTIEPMAQMTPPTEKDLNKRRGIMAWRFDLESKAENTIKFGYKVAWPQNMQVGMNLE
ncbi:MAG: mucoidy inhibitor MuiA family protein [Aestuariivirga sp.]